LQKYIKLNLYYLGQSKKHQIFRAKSWNNSLEKITNRPVFTEEFDEIGSIREIFGPVNLPFISMKISPKKEFNPNDNFYAKMR
jgi:rRNA processing protein Gar1